MPIKGKLKGECFKVKAMVKVLEGLGVDLTAKEHTAYKFKAAGFMDLNIDVWQEGGRQMVAISHYGEQNGDAMADPDVLCEVKPTIQYKDSSIEHKDGCKIINQDRIEGKRLIPVHFQNDYMGVFQQARIYKENGCVLHSPSLTKSINSFLVSWAKNIKAQKYKAA